jgi:prepilin-type N-terminal cleavage/methylation domain-containing protein
VSAPSEPRRTAAVQGGFTLVEVVLALALLGAVMIAVSGLFVLGARQLKSGRTHSVALSVARDIQEEMHGWHFTHLWEAFGSDGSTAVLEVDTRDPGPARRWQTLLDDELEPGAWARIRLESVDETMSPPALSQAEYVRVEIRVFWSEGRRERSASLATVRM